MSPCQRPITATILPHGTDRSACNTKRPAGTSCWIDPAGEVVVYGMDRKDAPTPSPAGCGKAEPWAPSKGWDPA
ncbi:hypothetical protein Cci01nite_59870 [Catellatospora citrea]|uniref:Uncharacterized protein n=1 Tax=Catellatospora citrea TaxID=53366 RepID=A0A8J3KPA3_9ACTN|nr:hypothetical protein Cci01nite_59870 [Catellatospora citrea]